MSLPGVEPRTVAGYSLTKAMQTQVRELSALIHVPQSQLVEYAIERLFVEFEKGRTPWRKPPNNSNDNR